MSEPIPFHGKRVISFCLWGEDWKYVHGMYANIILAPQIYPGWDVWIYADRATIDRTQPFFEDTECSYTMIEQPIADWRLMLSRFKAILDPQVEVMISRDADSRLSPREATAVREWLSSGKGVHTMHDHPHHTVPMLGGMWGCRYDAIPHFKESLESWQGEDRWQTDQEFLTQRVWPLIQGDVMNHDEFFRHLWGGQPFPYDRISDEFVGATVNANLSRPQDQVDALRRAIGWR